MQRHVRLGTLGALGASLLIAGCGDDPADPKPEIPTFPEHCDAIDAASSDEPTRVQAALCRLGVDVTAALPPIQDGAGNALRTPHEMARAAGASPWHPLGNDTMVYRAEREWFAIAPASPQTRLAAGIYEANNRNNELGNWAALRQTKLKELGNLDDNDPTSAWMHDSVKTGTAADLDGDGYEEAALVYLDRTTGALNLVITEDASASHEITHHAIGSFPHFAPFNTSSPGHLDVAAGDIDGDGFDELIIALGVRSYRSLPPYPQGDPNAWTESDAGAAKILVLDDKRAGFSQLAEKTFGTGDARAIYVATGNGLPDARHIEEIAVSASINGQAKAYVFQYDPDAAGDKLTLLMDDSLNLTVSGRSAYLADVTFGDLNRDGLGEFIFAGVEKPGPANPDTRYVAMSLHARAGRFVPAQTRAWTDATSGDWVPSNQTGTCVNTSTCDFIKVLDVFAEVLDLQGDGHAEVLINNAVYTDAFAAIPDSDGTVVMAGMLNNDNGQPRNDAGGDIINAPHTVFHRSNTWISVGDFDGNGKDEIAFWGRNRGAHLNPPDSGAQAIQVFGWNTRNNFRTLGYRSLARNHADSPYGNYPVLFALNADDDSARVRFVRSHTNYSEPYPLVALAAAPCYADPAAEQNLEECHSTYTTFSSKADSFAEGGTFHLSVGGGYKHTGSSLEFELMAHYRYDYEGLTGTARELGESTSWEAGSNQDAVVFTSLPLDQFYYEVTAVGTIPLIVGGKTMSVGDEFSVAVPRRTSHMLVNLDYYNAVVASIAPDRTIGREVFAHVAGDPTTYPTSGDVDQLLPQFARPNLPVYRTSADRVVTVPQGGANVVALTLSEDVTRSESYSHEFSGAVSFAGNLGGFAFEVEVGGGYKRDIELSNTTGFELEASIGGIGNDRFYEEHRYGVGTFSYFRQVGGRDLRVVNFWREPR